MSDWKLIQLSPEEWKQNFSENIHKVVFKEIRQAEREVISYALLVIKDEEVMGYVTVKQYDVDSVYWQFGGVIPKFRRSMTAVKGIELALEWQRERAKRILTYVENTNLPMLRMYLAYGFIIIGTRSYNNLVMCDMLKEF